MTDGELKKRIKERLSWAIGKGVVFANETRFITEDDFELVYRILDEANEDFEIAKIVSAEKQPWDEEERLSMELKQILDWKKKYFGDPAK